MLLGRLKNLTSIKIFGNWGEKRCEKFLNKKGLKTLTRNFLCKTGEIDLIMLDSDGTIVFVEVKTRKSEDFTPAENALTYPKKSRMLKAATYFLSKNKIENRPCRFDFVTIVNDNKNEIINHYPNAFTP